MSLVPNALSSSKPVELLLAQVRDSHRVVHLWNTLEIAGHISVHQSKRPQNRWLLYKAAKGLPQHEQGVIATDIVCAAVLYEAFPETVGLAGMAMMDKMQVSEAHCAPAEGIRFHFIHGIPAWRRPEPTDGLPAGPPIDLRRAPNMKPWSFLELLDSVDDIANRAAPDTQLWFFVELQDASFKIVRFERQVPIELNQKLPVFCLQMLIALIECFDDAPAWFSKSPILSMYTSNPGMSRGVLVNDAISTVRRAVVHNDPLDRKNRLAEHTLESLAKVSLFVPDWSNDDILRSLIYHRTSFNVPVHAYPAFLAPL